MNASKLVISAVATILILLSPIAYVHSLSDRPYAVSKIVESPSLLRMALLLGLDPNLHTANGAPMLVQAIHAQDIDAVNHLLKFGASQSALDSEGRSGTFHAIVSESDSMFGLMIRDDQDVASLSSQMYQLAVETISEREVLAWRLPLMLSADSVSSTKSIDIDSLLSIAIDNHNKRAVEHLLLHGADISKATYAQVGVLTTAGWEHILQRAIDSGVSVSFREHPSPLFTAVENENFMALQLLLSADVNKSLEHAAMTLAILKGYPELAVELLRGGADPTRLFAGLSSVDAAEVVLDGIFIEQLRLTKPGASSEPLAAKVGDLLRSLGYIKSNTEQWTPEIANALLRFQQEHGLPVHGYPSAPTTHALRTLASSRQEILIASREGETPRVEALLAADPGAIGATDKKGWNALAYAAYYGHTGTVELLLERGAAAESADDRGSNTVLIAVISPFNWLLKARITRMLVEAGAKPDVRNSDGLSATMVARSLNDTDLNSVLGVRPAKPAAPPIVAVMGRPSNGQQAYTHQREFPAQWIKTKWTEELRITEVSHVRGEWFVVMSKLPWGARAQTYHSIKNIDQLSALHASETVNGLSLTKLVFAPNGSGIAVFTQPPVNATDGYKIFRDEATLEGLKEFWSEYEVTAVTPTILGSNVVIYGKALGLRRPQSVFFGDLSSVLESVKSSWAKGLHITSFSEAGGVWKVVVSEGSNLKDQSVVVADGLADLKQRIQARSQQGWGINYIVGATR